MKQQLSSPSFADLLVGQRKVKQTFFSQIDKIIDWNPIRGIIEIAYTKGNKATGRPSYDSLVLFKTELLRTWYGLSDGEVEEQVNDRLSFSRFVGLGLEDAAPDSTTVCRFRNILVEADLYDMVLNESTDNWSSRVSSSNVGLSSMPALPTVIVVHVVARSMRLLRTGMKKQASWNPRKPC